MVRTIVHGCPLNFPIHPDLLTSLLWDKKNEIGNEIRHTGVSVGACSTKFARAFKTPDLLYVYYPVCGDGSIHVYRFPNTISFTSIICNFLCVHCT